ncbi:unnamed protein product [Ambrosiozyma monospora]|uniref:Unnamed protein product n=1 Tax=Ambrosiozyma monospora TaxID=43982 RepID=A0ACB5U659_AMBMO|nr:unnamed protein product [Ambrosiozyma monospora]
MLMAIKLLSVIFCPIIEKLKNPNANGNIENNDSFETDNLSDSSDSISEKQGIPRQRKLHSRQSTTESGGYRFKDSSNSSTSGETEGRSNSAPVPELLSRRRISRGFHSNTPSISWSPNNSEDWTMDNVKTWLKLNDFNDSWVEGFEKRKLEKKKFMKLQSYQEIKKFSSEFDTSDAISNPTRFVQLLRRTLGRTHSSSLSMSGAPALDNITSPISLISESSSTITSSNEEDESIMGSLHPGASGDVLSTGDNRNGLRPHSVNDIGEKLAPVVSAPPPAHSNTDNNSNDDVSSLTSLNRKVERRVVPPKPRPYSAYERSSYNYNPNFTPFPSTVPVPAPSSTPNSSKTFFSIRHHKTASSDSSISASGAIGAVAYQSSDIPYTASNANTKKPHERTNSRAIRVAHLSVFLTFLETTKVLRPLLPLI